MEDKKIKTDNSSLVLDTSKTASSWEYQERSVYTVDAMEREIRERLSLPVEKPNVK